MKKLDTAELLAEEDERALQFILAIKQNLSSFIGAENIIDEIRTIIKESEHFAFRSKRNERIISKTRPLFVLIFDLNKFKSENGHNFGTFENDIEIVKNLVQNEITSVFSRSLSDRLRDKDYLNKLIEKSGITGINDDALLLFPFVTSSIFSINVELSTGLVYLEYVL